jgi:hypothetical protein
MIHEGGEVEHHVEFSGLLNFSVASYREVGAFSGCAYNLGINLFGDRVFAFQERWLDFDVEVHIIL